MRIRMRRPGNDFLDLGAAVRRGRRRRIHIRRSGNDFLDLGAAVARGVVCLSEGREGRREESGVHRTLKGRFPLEMRL